MICEKCGSNLPTKGMICPHCGHILNQRQVDMQKTIEEENRKKGVTPEYNSDKYGFKKNLVERKDKSSYFKIYLIIIAFLIALTVILLLSR